jgi:hypothetical protein
MKLKILCLIIIPAMICFFSATTHAQGIKDNSKDINSLGLNWNELGPDNIGGRTRAILIDRNNSDIMYAAGVAGGLWKSTTAGSSWTKINDFAENIAISAIAQGIDGAIYLGTGENKITATGTANGSTGFIGKGIYKSADGITFALLPSTIPFTANSDTSSWAFISKLACDPFNANRIYAATNKGLKSSDDGGISWINPVKNEDIVITEDASDVDVASDGMVVTSVGNKCFISANGNDNTFILHSDTLPGYLPASGLLRLELAISPSDPNFIYASIVNTAGSLGGIYKSTDKGSTWSIIGPGGSSSFQPFGNNGLKNNMLAVHPANPERIFVGGENLWIYQTGNTWTQQSLGTLDPTSSYYIHSGQNTIVFNPTNPNFLFIGTDGGISRSLDGGATFQTMNINYSTVQCNSIAASNDGKIIAGTQDNGTLYISGTGAFPKHAIQILGSDGGWTAISHINPEAFFATTPYAGTKRSPDKGSTFYPASDGSNPFFSVRMLNSATAGTSSFNAAPVTPFVLWESLNDNYSSDSILFTPEKITSEKIGKGETGQIHFTGTFEKAGQLSASIEPGSVDIFAGSVYISDDGSGHFTGDADEALSTIDYNSGAFDITFTIAPASGVNIVAMYNTMYNSGAAITIYSLNRPATFIYTTPVSIQSQDTVKVQDIIQSKFYLGLNNGIWMTKMALDFSNRPKWFRVAALTSDAGETTQCLALSKDGNILFTGTSAGKLYKISNLRTAQDSLTSDIGLDGFPNSLCFVSTKQITIPSNGRAITSISVDPNDANKIIVTLGNYGYDDYIYYSSNALDSTPVFTSKQGNLPKMPVYSSLIPIFTNNAIIIGTEFGVYSTNNISASSPLWADENAGMAHVPVYMIWQQTHNFPSVTNNGTIYIGTHGRGVFACTKYTSIQDYNPSQNTDGEIKLNSQLYPNPVSDNSVLSFSISQKESVIINLYSLSGKLLKEDVLSNLNAGKHLYNVNCKDLTQGTYLIRIIAGGKQSCKKIIKL